MKHILIVLWLLGLSVACTTPSPQVPMADYTGESTFDVDATEFNHQNAVWLARFADLAYLNEDEVESKLKKWGFEPDKHEFGDLDNFQFFEGEATDTQGYIIADEHVIVIAFRGSESERDWVRNLLAFQGDSPLGVGFVHHGFIGNLYEILPDLESALIQLRSNNQHVWIAGHSLGGALAILAASHLEPIGLQGIYTFGQPVVGDTVFSARYDQLLKDRTYRFIEYGDPVPRLGVGIQVGNAKFFAENGFMSETDFRKDSLLENLLAITPGNHLIGQYLYYLLLNLYPGMY